MCRTELGSQPTALTTRCPPSVAFVMRGKTEPGPRGSALYCLCWALRRNLKSHIGDPVEPVPYRPRSEGDVRIVLSIRTMNNLLISTLVVLGRSEIFWPWQIDWARFRTLEKEQNPRTHYVPGLNESLWLEPTQSPQRAVPGRGDDDWSSTSIRSNCPARIRSRVTRMSASLGVGSPPG